MVGTVPNRRTVSSLDAQPVGVLSLPVLMHRRQMKLAKFTPLFYAAYKYTKARLTGYFSLFYSNNCEYLCRYLYKWFATDFVF